MSRRESNHVRYPYKKDDCFLESTKAEFRDIWRTHFRIESMAENTRQRLSKRPLFNVYDAFATCDINEDGRITKDEIRELIESRGFYVTEKEVRGLVDKYDKDRDGRISYSEVSIPKKNK